jgi:hypothetical protein
MKSSQQILAGKIICLRSQGGSPIKFTASNMWRTMIDVEQGTRVAARRFGGSTPIS